MSDSHKNQYTRTVLGAGHRIFGEGDLADMAFLIEDGQVEISKKRASGKGHIEVAMLGRGEIFGELALLGDHPRMATARAVTEVTLMEIPKHSFIERYETLNPVMQKVILVMANRLRDASQKLAEQDNPFFTS